MLERLIGTYLLNDINENGTFCNGSTAYGDVYLPPIRPEFRLSDQGNSTFIIALTADRRRLISRLRIPGHTICSHAFPFTR